MRIHFFKFCRKQACNIFRQNVLLGHLVNQFGIAEFYQCFLNFAKQVSINISTVLHIIKQQLIDNLARIEQEIKQNQDTIDYLSTDEYVDQYAREYLNMQGKNEEAFTGK